ncbi:MAG: hypothetical protein ABIK09_21155 [Pseudomonadota bacterium]
MNLAFGPVSFEAHFDPALDPIRLDKLVRAAAPPKTLRYDPWPRRVHRILDVVIGPSEPASSEPRFVEERGRLSFQARGAVAYIDSGGCGLTLDPSLRPGEMMDQLTLTLAATGVAALLEEGLGVVLHASTSAQSGRAWTFPAPHATGKSTVVNRLDPDRKITDDLTTLVPGDDGLWRAGGVNATGTGTLPLGGLLFLRRGGRTTLGPALPVAEALRLAIRNAVLFPGSPTLSALLMDRLIKIVAEVPCRMMDVSLKDLDRALFRRLTCPTT